MHGEVGEMVITWVCGTLVTGSIPVPHPLLKKRAGRLVFSFMQAKKRGLPLILYINTIHHKNSGLVVAIN